MVKEMNESRDSRPQIIRRAEDSRVPDVPTKPPPARMTFSPSFTVRTIYLLRFSLRCSHGAGCGLFDETSDRLRMRHVHGMAAFDLHDGRSCALGHDPLGVRRDHLVFGSDKVPAWLCLLRRLGDRTAKSFDTPRDLRVGHKRSHI